MSDDYSSLGGEQHVREVISEVAPDDLHYTVEYLCNVFDEWKHSLSTDSMREAQLKQRLNQQLGYKVRIINNRARM